MARTSVFLHEQVVLHELVGHALDVGPGLVHLVHRHQHRHTRLPSTRSQGHKKEGGSEERAGCCSLHRSDVHGCRQHLFTLSLFSKGGGKGEKGSYVERATLLLPTRDGWHTCLAHLMASTVCSLTPSSAATTSTTISVTLAPRARISEKAAWPGVSMNVMGLPLHCTCDGEGGKEDVRGRGGGGRRLESCEATESTPMPFQRGLSITLRIQTRVCGGVT